MLVLTAQSRSFTHLCQGAGSCRESASTGLSLRRCCLWPRYRPGQRTRAPRNFPTRSSSGCSHARAATASRAKAAGTNEYYPRIAGKPAAVPLSPARQFPRRPAHLSADGLLHPLSLRRIPACEIATYYSKLKPPFPTPIQPSATKDALARGGNAGAARRPREGHPAVRRLPRQGAHRHAARHPGPGRTVSRLHQRADGRMAGRLSARDRARLHGEDRCEAERHRHRAAVAAYLAYQPGTPATLPEPEAARNCRSPVAASRNRRPDDREAAGDSPSSR